MKNCLFYCFIVLTTFSFSQKNENRIIHINGDDTLIMNLEGVTGNIDSLIEKTLKSFYQIEENDDFRKIELTFDTLFSKDFNLKSQNSQSTEPKDTVKLKIGNMNIVIIEDIENEKKPRKYQDRKIIIDKEIKLEEIDKGSNQIKLKELKKEPEAYWAGITYGATGMLNNSGNFTSELDADYLKFDYVRSYEIQFNFLEKRFPIYRNYLGVTTGLGLKWNRFTLDNNNINLNYNDTLLFSSSSSVEYKRSTLRSAHLQAPLLFELCSNKDPEKAWHLSIGVVGGLRIGSSWRTKVDNDVSNSKGDFNFRPFTASGIAILGYNDVSLYASYGLSNVFEKNTAPQTKMVSAGIMLNF